MKKIIIAAVAENGVIGKDNNLIWRLPDDMKFFKEQTIGHSIITGRKSYESIPEKFRPLPDRINIIVTRNEDYQVNNAYVTTDIENALVAAKIVGGGESDENKCFIIGGGEIYKQTIDLVDEMLITKVHAEFEGDVYFPIFNENDWIKELIVTKSKDEKHKYDFTIYKYTRK